MLRAQGLFPDRQCPLIERLGLRVLALVVVKRRQVVEARGYVGVLRAQGLFPDRQRPLVKRLGLRVLALALVKLRQVVEAPGHVGVLRALEPFPKSPARAHTEVRPSRRGLGCSKATARLLRVIATWGWSGPKPLHRWPAPAGKGARPSRIGRVRISKCRFVEQLRSLGKFETPLLDQFHASVA